MTGLENLWHMYYKVTVYTDDCTNLYSYACMHVGDHSYKITIEGM